MNKAMTLALLPFAFVSLAAFAQSTDSRTTVYNTAQGTVTVHSGQPEAKQYGPPPPFAQLATDGSGYITSAGADAYPPLANDFIHADSNRDGRISRTEYARWSKSH